MSKFFKVIGSGGPSATAGLGIAAVAPVLAVFAFGVSDNIQEPETASSHAIQQEVRTKVTVKENKECS